MTGYGATSWNGVLVPAGVAKPILAKLNADIVTALHAADGVRAARCRRWRSSRQWRHIGNELIWAKVKAAGLKPE